MRIKALTGTEHFSHKYSSLYPNRQINKVIKNRPHSSRKRCVEGEGMFAGDGGVLSDPPLCPPRAGKATSVGPYLPPRDFSHANCHMASPASPQTPYKYK